MIIHKHKAFFFHIQKTGGTSMQTAWGWNRKNPPPGQHWMPSRTRKEFGQRIWNEFFKFTFVRNPWDRLVSFYCYWDLRDVFEPGTNFEDFVLDIVKRNKHEAGKRHCPSCIKCLQDPECFDFIGRFENLKEDYEYVCDQIGAEKCTLPHIHKSKRTHYSHYYDDELKEIVARKYCDDIKYFGYEFESEPL